MTNLARSLARADHRDFCCLLLLLFQLFGSASLLQPQPTTAHHVPPLKDFHREDPPPRSPCKRTYSHCAYALYPQRPPRIPEPFTLFSNPLYTTSRPPEPLLPRPGSPVPTNPVNRLHRPLPKRRSAWIEHRMFHPNPRIRTPHPLPLRHLRPPTRTSRQMAT